MKAALGPTRALKRRLSRLALCAGLWEAGAALAQAPAPMTSLPPVCRHEVAAAIGEIDAQALIRFFDLARF